MRITTTRGDIVPTSQEIHGQQRASAAYRQRGACWTGRGHRVESTHVTGVPSSQLVGTVAQVALWAPLATAGGCVTYDDGSSYSRLEAIRLIGTFKVLDSYASGATLNSRRITPCGAPGRHCTGISCAAPAAIGRLVTWGSSGRWRGFLGASRVLPSVDPKDQRSGNNQVWPGPQWPVVPTDMERRASNHEN